VCGDEQRDAFEECRIGLAGLVFLDFEEFGR
jgi:hypothetical protein